jgi:hypothetical protein
MCVYNDTFYNERCYSDIPRSRVVCTSGGLRSAVLYSVLTLLKTANVACSSVYADASHRFAGMSVLPLCLQVTRKTKAELAAAAAEAAAAKAKVAAAKAKVATPKAAAAAAAAATADNNDEEDYISAFESLFGAADSDSSSSSVKLKSKSKAAIAAAGSSSSSSAMQELGELPLDSQPYDEKFGQGLGSTGDAAQVHTVNTTIYVLLARTRVL